MAVPVNANIDDEVILVSTEKGIPPGFVSCLVGRKVSMLRPLTGDQELGGEKNRPELGKYSSKWERAWLGRRNRSNDAKWEKKSL